MLEYIRTSAQSFGVKVAFGVIILVFVFWGIGNFNDRDYTNVVAVVNGQPIVALEFEKAYHNAEEYILRNNPGMTRETLIKEHLGRQVLNELIQQTLLAQEAERAGVKIMPEEMRAAVGGIKSFQDENGKFDPEAYQRVLAAQRMTPAQYEKELADQLLRDKMFSLVTAGAWIDPSEARHRFDFLRERRVVEYLFVPAEKFVDEVKVTEEEARKEYDASKSSFAIPPMVNVEYINVSPAALVDRKDIPEEAALRWYEANRTRFERPEQIHVSHILVQLPPDADEAAEQQALKKIIDAKARIAGGEPFAKVADEINDAKAADKGGDLGWVSAGETIPEFEEAVFKLPVGELSDPLRTPFGYHLAKVTEKREAGVKPFADVADEAYAAVAFEEGSEKLPEVLDNLIEDNILMKPLADSASRYNLKVEKSGLLDKAALVEKLHVKPEGADALLAVPAGSPLDTTLEAGDNYLVARITEASPASVKPFDDVRAEIEKNIANARARELAMSRAAEILKSSHGKSMAQVKELQPDLKVSSPLDRMGVLTGFAPDEQLITSIFATPIDNWIPAPVTARTDAGKDGAIIAYVDKIMPPDKGEFEGMEQLLANAAKQQRTDGLFALFMHNLAQKAKVEITNANLVDRVNM